MWAILTGVILLIVLVYLRISVIIAAPLCVTIVALLKGYPPLDILEGPYVEGMAFFIKDFIFIILLGALLGKLMHHSGAADTLAYRITHFMGPSRGTTAVLLTSTLLACGGIPSFVIIFSIYRISLTVFKEANLPRYLLPACIMSGVTNVALFLPGSPQMHNIIPMEYLGTGPLAGFVPGVAGVFTSFVLVLIYLEIKANRAHSKGQGFVTKIDEQQEAGTKSNLGTIKSLLPLLIVFFTFAVVRFSVMLALLAGVLAAAILFYPYLRFLIVSVNEGVQDALTPLLFAASAVGFGLSLQSFPDFAALLEKVMGLPWDPLVIASLVTNLGAAIMGSASGGIVLSLSITAEELALRTDPSSLHRIMVMASGVMDTVPYNNTYLAILAVTGLSFKETYLDYFVVTVLTPLAGLLVALAILLW